MPLESATHLLARAIYATHNTILPVIASLVGLVTTIAAANLLAGPVGLVALPLAFAAGMAAKVARARRHGRRQDAPHAVRGAGRGGPARLRDRAQGVEANGTPPSGSVGTTARKRPSRSG